LPDSYHVVVSAEHAGNEIPARYRTLFDSDAARRALVSHRGWDPGSAEIASLLARECDAPLVAQRVSRLLVECNRSLGHRALWSEFSRGLAGQERSGVLDRYWHAHRDAVRRLVDRAPEGATVVHVGVHTFTPVWKERPRATDIGLLLDPRRRRERHIAGRWRRGLARAFAAEGLRVHLNLPYRGWTDGLTTTLRGQLPEDRYVGIELEVSQRLVPLPAEAASRLAAALRSSLV
jgi:predicted N-formylglutamate amidohydrolase